MNRWGLLWNILTGLLSNLTPGIRGFPLVHMESRPWLENILISYLVIPTEKLNGLQATLKQQDPLEHGISLALGRIIDIRVIQQGLDTQNNLEKSIRISPLEIHFPNTHLFDGNSRLP
jgi:hypothetical protein